MFIVVFASALVLSFSENNQEVFKDTFASQKGTEKIFKFRKSKRLDPLLRRAEIKVFITV